MGLLLGRGGGEFAIEDIQLPENIILTENILGKGKFGKVVLGFINEDISIGKKHALKKYDYFTLNTSCFLGST